MALSRLSVTLSRKSGPAWPATSRDLFPDGVAVRDAPGGLGVADHAGVVVAEHGPLAGHARHDGLAAAGEAGEEVRLDEAGQDLEVAAQRARALSQISWPLRGQAQADLGRRDRRRRSGRCGSRSTDRVPTMARSSASVLGRCVPSALKRTISRPGTASRTSSTAARRSGFGAGRVMSLKTTPTRMPGADEVSEGRRADGRRESAADGGGRVGQGGNVGRLDDGDVERVVELERQAGLPVSERDAHIDPYFSVGTWSSQIRLSPWTCEDLVPVFS